MDFMAVLAAPSPEPVTSAAALLCQSSKATYLAATTFFETKAKIYVN